ncbi:MAG TPA: biotin/lipoate A/B protein ligase family protein [Candidatus Kapabacteria bacterium]|nr:biotin/lipoate A/B protein ligase family protein [Candidatus Kapabacteria bacterium]
MNIFTNDNWLIEEDFDKNGAYHMARDLEVVEKVRDDPSAPNVLRLYTWKPYAISLGYRQDESSINLEVCKKAGVDVVRRPTGGRAVYHAEELTYAVIMRFEPGEGIYAVHNKIAESLLELLQPLAGGRLALTSSRDSTPIREVYKPGTLTNIACFTSTARYEITLDRKKVVGSAQRRFGNAVLQHGSILLGNEHLRLPDFLNISSEEKIQMRKLLEEESATIGDNHYAGNSIEKDLMPVVRERLDAPLAQE